MCVTCMGLILCLALAASVCPAATPGIPQSCLVYSSVILASVSQSPVAQLVKNLPAMQNTWVKSLGQEDLLEKEMATHFSILAWRIPWTEDPGGLHTVAKSSKESDMTEATTSFSSVQSLRRV